MANDSEDLPGSDPLPAYRPPTFADYLDEQRCLWWNAAGSRWVEISYEAFIRARGTWWIEKMGGEAEGETLTRCGTGDHRFVICMMDDTRTQCVYFHAHRYVLDGKGMIDHFPTTLSKDEDEEYKRLDMKRCTAKQQPELDSEEQARFERLADQQWEVTRLPPDLLIALKRDIPWGTDPGDHPRGGFWGAYQHHNKAVENLAARFGVST